MLRAHLAAAAAAARAGGEAILGMSRQHLTVTAKSSPSDIVTSADRESDRLIASVLHRTGLPILSEEHPRPAATSGPIWVVDPLDGTTNYARGLPGYAVSIALVQFGRPLVAAIYEPETRDLYTALRGAGAFLNGRPISTRRTASLAEFVVGVDMPYDRSLYDSLFATWHELAARTGSLRNFGAAALALAYLAAGRLDAVWLMGVKPWDHAAGRLLVTEAGGQVWEPSPRYGLWGDALLATSGAPGRELLPVVPR